MNEEIVYCIVRDGEQCDQPADTQDPVPLCRVHGLQVALNIVPRLINNAIREASTPGIASQAGPEPVDIDSVPDGRHEPLVYFILNGGRIKIGHSTNLIGRLNTLSLREEAVVLLLRGGRSLETSLHNRFRRSRIRGTEWFELSPKLIHYMGTCAARPLTTAKLHELGIPRPTQEQILQQQSAARTAVRDALTEILGNGATVVGPRDLLNGYRKQIGRSRAWISAEMSRLADEGLLHPTNEVGVYAFDTQE